MNKRDRTTTTGCVIVLLFLLVVFLLGVVIGSCLGNRWPSLVMAASVPTIEQEEWQGAGMPCERVQRVKTETPLYAVCGTVLDEDLQTYLYTRLKGFGIEWWMPYAIIQMYQESSFQVNQVTNGLDKGILQYRYLYWDEWCDRAGVERGDIFDPYKQIAVYTSMVKQWLDKGCSVAQTISNHNTGGWSNDYSQEYVDQVMRWEDRLTKVR